MTEFGKCPDKLWVIIHGERAGGLMHLLSQEQVDIAKIVALYPELSNHFQEVETLKIIRHYKSGEVLHIETPNGVVNIRVGLFDRKGRSVDSIAVSPDAYANEPKVVLYGRHNTRLVRLKGGER